MATGGSGDVLAGLIGALIGQGMSRLEAAKLAVYVHALAGEQCARRGPSILASELAFTTAGVLQELTENVDTDARL